ncbi:MATE family efflux transporter [Candidatus Sulfidibacterium hydrothermale]|uniref:MATE family efflux transporter n=1 Tax=Candidatus Sulfidibacterium hydrothermale TaxID=2875962 RepID=UPI001F0A6545|nr:MATE family efflux transporter [Candidatus Sulfidibacterium hydrothermale]UBM61464.1 MATE family efflux transporter [Candidatus Sulfidibacterium hydrothermale]
MANAKKKLNREIFRLAVPNIVSNLTVPLLGIADYALMGHLKSDSVMYVGAVALGTTIFNVVYMSLGFLRMGTSGFTAQSYGAGNHEALHRGLHRSLLVALGLALILLLLQYPIQWIAFRLLDGTPQVTHFARRYFYIRIYAAPATLMLYSFYGWFLGMQNARIPMTIAVVVNIMNIGLNFLFVYPFHMHSDGVALASVLAQYTGLLLAFLFLFKKYKPYARRLSLKILAQKEGLLIFFKVNSDIFIRTILLIFVLTFFTGISARINDKILAVNTLLFQFFFFFSYFADGFAFAGEALAGKAKGSGNVQLLKMTVHRLFFWGSVIAFVTALIYFFGLKYFMVILTNNPALLHLAKAYYGWVIILPLTSLAAFIWDGIYVGVTASKAMRNTMIFSALFVFLPAFYFLFPTYQNHGLWLALQLFMLSRGISMGLLAPKAVYRIK